MAEIWPEMFFVESGKGSALPRTGAAASGNRGRRAGVLPALAVAAACCLQQAAAQSLALGDTPLFYETSEKELGRSLEEISVLIGLPVSTAGLPDFTVSGQFAAGDAASFLNEFCITYDLDWLELDGTILISAADARMQAQFDFETEDQASEFLLDLDRRFVNRSAFPRRIEQGGQAGFAVQVNAPRPYIDFASDLRQQLIAGSQEPIRSESAVIATAPEPATQREPAIAEARRHQPIAGSPAAKGEDAPRQHGVMRFQLRHAWALDKEFQSSEGGPPTVIPGAAQIFSELVQAASIKSAELAEDARLQQAAAAEAGGEAAAESSTSLFGFGSLPSLADLGTESVPSIRTPTPTRPQLPASGNQRRVQVPNITVDARTNAILVYGDLANHDFYAELISNLDRPTQMIELEAMVLDVNVDQIGELGLGAGLFADGDSAFGQLDLIVNTRKFFSRLQLLNGQGSSRIVSQPSLLVLDNHPASIESAERFYVKVGGDGGENSTPAALFPVSTGTRLHVTPRIVDDLQARHRRIHMAVSIRDGTIDTSSNMIDGLPRINERSINTQAVIYHGESLLIGGHIITTESSDSTEVPGFSELPFLGGLFSASGERKREVVRLYLLRPNLVEMSYDRVSPAVARLENGPAHSKATLSLAPPPTTERLGASRAWQESVPVMAGEPEGRDSQPGRADAAPVAPPSLLEQARSAGAGIVDESTAETVLLRIIEADGRRPAPQAAAGRLQSPALADGTYSLQIGAFSQAERARRLRDKVIGLGLNSYVQQWQQGGDTIISRVRVGAFPSLNAARQAQVTLARHGIGKSVLIRN